MQEKIISILLHIPVILISLPFHEFAHAYVAHLLGDDTAKYSGRLTLNPLKHLDPFGLICFLIAGFGWAKPVPVNTLKFKKQRLGFALTALAGPVANLLLALVSFLLLVIFRFAVPNFIEYIGLSGNVYYVIYLLLVSFCTSNIMLAVFNMIPIPPLDGSRILSLILPASASDWLLKNERYISIIAFAAIVAGVFDAPLTFISNAVVIFLYSL